MSSLTQNGGRSIVRRTRGTRNCEDDARKRGVHALQELSSIEIHAIIEIHGTVDIRGMLQLL